MTRATRAIAAYVAQQASAARRRRREPASDERRPSPLPLGYVDANGELHIGPGGIDRPTYEQQLEQWSNRCAQLRCSGGPLDGKWVNEQGPSFMWTQERTRYLYLRVWVLEMLYRYQLHSMWPLAPGEEPS